jgi:hypothetical protein
MELLHGENRTPASLTKYTPADLVRLGATWSQSWTQPPASLHNINPFTEVSMQAKVEFLRISAVKVQNGTYGEICQC